ncbi:uncharacterized protein N7496_002648 [Penicillium cataractarum]|uniref:Uncharacterized protein n=1 Tax=Penicillium cataractarum TaxID=2100454 RepID=A0A9W9SLN1_9EURO|nr:uncharacterized protein N7496_002648 [Penicillium cataractarum]KAJ5380220.1 hypothetical protein N7496_002648 [Penicillium cataractarum]
MPITSEPQGSFFGHLFHAIWAAVSTFFDTTWFLTSSLFGALFEVMLPATIAAAIVGGVVLAAILAVVYIVNWMGCIQFEFGAEKTGTSSSKAAGDGSDAVLVDVTNDKRRVEIEIEFLEELLRAKREKLEKLE